MSGKTLTRDRPSVLSNGMVALGIAMGLLALLVGGYFLALALALAVLAAPYVIGVRAVVGLLRNGRGPRQGEFEAGAKRAA